LPERTIADLPDDILKMLNEALEELADTIDRASMEVHTTTETLQERAVGV
jgi:hypothetical protein